MSARDFDSQLLESVSVRRRRMRDALLHGSMRSQRSTDEQLGKVFGGIALAAVLCAGCVGWSFVSHKLMHPAAPASAPASSTAPSDGASDTPSNAPAAKLSQAPSEKPSVAPSTTRSVPSPAGRTTPSR